MRYNWLKNGQNNTSRTHKVYLNSIVTLVTQLLQVVLGFVVRKVFILGLGISYLGYNSVFANVLRMLNLADLGVGIAITSYLYKPLASGDKEKVNALMFIYKKIYSILGLCVLGLGIAISFFMPLLIPDADCSYSYIRVLFYINLVGTVSTYYLAYNRTLLIADQKTYITSLIDAISYIVCSGLQIIFILVMPNYVVFLSISILKNIISNIIVTISVKKRYVYNKAINENHVKEYLPLVKRYVKDVFISRIGAYVFHSTDNIIISVFRGSLLV